MHFKKSDNYFTIAIYVIGTLVVILIIGTMLFYIRTLWGYLAIVLKETLILLKPLLFGLGIAYLFDPLVELYDKRCFKVRWAKYKNEKNIIAKRLIPTTLAFITLSAFVWLFVMVVSVNIKEVIGAFNNRNFQEMLGYYIARFTHMLEEVSNMVAQTPFLSNQSTFVLKVYTTLNDFTLSLIERFIASLRTFWDNVLPLGLGFAIAFYALNDKRQLLAIYHKMLENLLPQKLGKEIREIGRAIDYVFSGYIRGQLLDAVIMGSLISCVLTLINIDFAIIIGIISGIFNLIPYFGPIVGFILAGVIGLMDPDPNKAIYAVLAVVALQQLDAWVIVPRIMGETVKLHPIVVLLAIVIGGQLFGFVGFLLGVPIAGFIRLMIIRYVGDVFDVSE